jgi:hypothetical protein
MGSVNITLAMLRLDDRTCHADLMIIASYFVRSLTRFSDKGEIPPLSEEQIDALETIERIALREALHMVLEVGDIQFVSGNHVLHARTAYVDHPPPHPKRQLMRLWLSVPESEGGWKLPFHGTSRLYDKRRHTLSDIPFGGQTRVRKGGAESRLMTTRTRHP